MEAKRRRHLTNEGEPLIVANDAMAPVTRYAQWRDETGLGDDRIINGTLCVVPLPKYISLAEGTRQFAGVKPESLWHPLFWLPPRLTKRYNMPNGTGGFEPESDELWGLRIGLEMTTSGLYRPDDGWVDVMSLIGLDVENDVDLARLEEWLAGEPDDLLDTVDLEPLLYKGDGDDAMLISAVGMLEILTEQQWAMVANSMLMMLWEAADTDGVALAHLVDTSILVATLARTQLAEVPVDSHEEPAPDFWERVRADMRKEWTNREAFIQGPFKQAEDWLELTRDTYWEASKEITEELLLQGSE